ncbi:hypothetical protein SO802_029236 [Lithocarpus litseifolius]|uniref:DUF659 domain-containing protein n=1 Tax=Lithocarpus litseifolius TaxID=425828 RepID=A0AAW2BV20_9ROSI
MAIARWMYDNCIYFNAVNSVYYQRMIDVVATAGPGYKGPSYHAVRVPLLRDQTKEVQLLVNSQCRHWAEVKCTLMADGWTNTRHRSLINFLVYCPRRMDMGNMPHVDNLKKRASKVTVFIYNHVVLIAWLRNRPSWTDIVRPGVTRFPTTFLSFGSIHVHKHDLQALVISKFFVDNRLARESKAKEVVAIILDNSFWDDINVLVKISLPLIRLLRIVDSD